MYMGTITRLSPVGLLLLQINLAVSTHVHVHVHAVIEILAKIQMYIHVPGSFILKIPQSAMKHCYCTYIQSARRGQVFHTFSTGQEVHVYLVAMITLQHALAHERKMYVR